MSSLAQVRTALAARVATTGLAMYARLADIVDPPAGVLLRSASSPRTDYGRTTQAHTFTLIVVTRRADLNTAQTGLDEYVERGTSKSIYDAIDADKTLGGMAQTVTFADFAGDQEFEVGTIPYWGTAVDVTVIPTAVNNT